MQWWVCVIVLDSLTSSNYLPFFYSKNNSCFMRDSNFPLLFNVKYQTSALVRILGSGASVGTTTNTGAVSRSAICPRTQTTRKAAYRAGIY